MMACSCAIVVCRWSLVEREDKLFVTFHLHKRADASEAADKQHAATNADTAAAGDLQIVAASGTRSRPSAHWKYVSDQAFVAATGKPWSSLGLKMFKATSRAGVEVWLKWIVEHTRAQP